MRTIGGPCSLFLLILTLAGGNVPTNANVIDLGEATILPGLADLHTPLTSNEDISGYRRLTISDTDAAIRGVVYKRTQWMPKPI